MRSLPLAALLTLIAGCASTHPIRPQIASQGTDFAGAQTVDVRLSNFHFAPDTVRLKAGQPYALTLINSASSEHTFTAPEFFAAAKVASADAARIASGQVELKPGATVVVHLVPAAGEYGLVCTETGHALLGMRGKIAVN